LRKIGFSAFFLCYLAQISAQFRLQVLDSVSTKPLVGVSIQCPKYKLYLHTDLEGYVQLPVSITHSDTIYFSMLGYNSTYSLAGDFSDKILMSPRQYILRETKISPFDPRDYILRAFDSFQPNHVPYPYKQKVFFREEYIVNDAYLRFQEMDMDIYQFPKSKDSRKYYISGSYPKVNALYRMDDIKKMNEVKSSLGTIVGKSVNFNYLSMYSYTKGVNIMNFIFTTLLEDKEAKYKYLGMENIKGYQALHIQGNHFEGSQIKYTTHVFLEENSYAVMHFSILASDYDISKKYIDFKTKLALWFLGIKFKVNKYYAKIQFQRTKEGIWVVEDYMTMVPVSIRKKTQLDGMLNINYRMSPIIDKTAQPLGYQIYSENQFLFDKYISNPRFGDKLSYSIPLVPIQKERLGRMVK
jgi:hypothetical protein